MRKMFKKYAKNIIADISSKTAINIAVKLYDEGYKNLVMVAGSDRVKEFDTLLGTYNGVEGKRHGYYKFDSIKVVSAGERDPDAEGVEGMSASKMRVSSSQMETMMHSVQVFLLHYLMQIRRNYIVMFANTWVFVKNVIWEICLTLKLCVMHTL